MTKPFTGVAFMMLADKGKVSGRSVSMYIPQMSNLWVVVEGERHVAAAAAGAADHAAPSAVPTSGLPFLTPMLVRRSRLRSRWISGS